MKEADMEPNLARRPSVRRMLLAAGAPAFAPDAAWPSKPIRLIVPLPTGGGSDNIARLIPKTMTEQLGQPVIVENKPGAAATIGSQFVAKAPTRCCWATQR